MPKPERCNGGFILKYIIFTIDDYVRVCYYTNWAQYRNGEGKFTPSNIEADICTHIVYSFAKVVNGKLANYEWNDDGKSINDLYAYQ